MKQYHLKRNSFNDLLTNNGAALPRRSLKIFKHIIAQSICRQGSTDSQGKFEKKS